MFTLRFDKLYNKDRVMQPCYVSIPFAKGELFDTKEVCLMQQDKVLLLQSRVLSRYQDGSVRYLFLRFLADIPANKGAEVLCDVTGNIAGAEVKTVEHGDVYKGDGTINCDEMSCSRTENGYRVSTGKISFVVTHKGNSLFASVETDTKTYTSEQFTGPVLKKAGKEKASCVQYGDWRIVEEGPVCVVLSNKGKLFADENTASEEGILCEIRVTAYAGKSCADVEVRLVNATEEALSMAAYEFAFTEKASEKEYVRTCVASSNYKTDFVVSKTGESVEKNITAEFIINEGNEHFAEVFYGTFFADRTTDEGGICATIYQAHQNYPKAVLAEREGITVKLIPEGSGPVLLQPGMAVKQQFQLYFHNAVEDLQEINHQSTMYQMPDRPVLDASVYEKSGLYPDIFVEKENQHPDVECALILEADDHTRSYGMMNWGDAPDPHYTAQGRGGGRPVWTNNEYDFPHACMLAFVRTGIRRFLDYCIITGTHQRDVDVCHFSKNELLMGGQWEHTDGHSNGVIVCSHEWVEGLLDCYHATGDERFFETAIGIGENVLRLLDTPEYQKKGGLNARETGWALRTLTALYKESFDTKWTEKSQWIVGQFKEWAEMYGGWLAPYTDNTSIRVPFMIAVAVGSLMRHYREFPSDDVKDMIIRAVDDMVENCLMDNGHFFYKELPSLCRVGNNPLVLEALAIAYELTGEEKYLRFGKNTFRSNINPAKGMVGSGKRQVEDAVIVGNSPTKRFAQMFIPVVTYYKALTEEHKKGNDIF